ncbi:hypothetical protein ACIQ9Q_30875 [Streptomyces sp. NPDC094438]
MAESKRRDIGEAGSHEPDGPSLGLVDSASRRLDRALLERRALG